MPTCKRCGKGPAFKSHRCVAIDEDAKEEAKVISVRNPLAGNRYMGAADVIELTFGEYRLSISTTEQGTLVIRETKGTSLKIKPVAANAIELVRD